MTDTADQSGQPSDELRQHADDPAEGADPDERESGRDSDSDSGSGSGSGEPREHAEGAAEG